MRVKQFQLELENGEIVTCSLGGQGKRYAFIVGGPGSFYLKGLAALQDEYTFITCDNEWTYGKSSTLLQKPKVKEINKEKIMQRDHRVIDALKKYFNITEIDGFGFSAPGTFLFEEALRHPEDFTCIIGTGIGLVDLDPTFTKTNAIFSIKATREQQERFKEHQNKYQLLASSLEEKSLPTDKDLLSFFNLKETTKIPLKPHKKFLAETMAMATKLLSKYLDEENVKAVIIEHWKHNPFGEHVDKEFQEYFFTAIYPHLRPLQTIMELTQKRQILLIYGEEDFVTPLPEDIQKILAQNSAIKLKIIKRCGHVPYKESPAPYAEIIRDFVRSHNMSMDARNTPKSVI